MASRLTAIAFFVLLLTFGESSDRVEPPSAQENAFDASSYAVHWDPEHAPSEENGFGQSSYAVHWDPDHTPSTSKENGFGQSAYAVHWDPDHTPSKENGFGESAYAVHWDPDHAPSKETGFGESAYAVHWDPDHAPSKKTGFGESAYAVHWDPDHALSKETGFGESAYAVHWDPDHAPSKETGFGESAYAVHWDPDHAPSKDNAFGASAYAVHWDPDHAPSPSAVPQAQAKRQQIKVQTGMLFLKKNLRIGTVLPQGTMFARAGSPKSVNSVSTPLESKYLATILSHYKIPHSSIKAKQVADTLHSCGKPADEEPHMCFSSREDMARFATKALGVSGARAAITSIHGHETTNSMYVVAQIAQFSNNVVPCHPMDFPYEVFYCHRPREVQSLTVQLKDLKDGTTGVTTTAMCHMNTSDWDEQYFELLGGERGEPICHYMPTNYIMFY